MKNTCLRIIYPHYDVVKTCYVTEREFRFRKIKMGSEAVHEDENRWRFYVCVVFAQNGDSEDPLENGSTESAHDQRTQPELIEVPDENGDSQLMVSEHGVF